MNFIYFFAGLIGGGAIVWIYFSNKKKDTGDIKNILSPLETKLNEFTSAFQSAYRDEANQRNTLKGQIETLSTLNKELSNEAKELANALKGDNKVQGNWGEQVLENILERSGLRKNLDYSREEILEIDSIDGDGRADVIVKIPDGGSIIIESDRNLNTLIDFRYSQHFKAQHGQSGSKKNKTGGRGKDLVLKVPVGTQIYEEDNNTLIYDFLKNKEKFLLAAGGKGGLGNVRFKSSTNRAPKKKTNGKIGEEFWIWLQLKVIADIGIIGLPNAGKSSLLSALTRARPKIANYPFTTINPNLGVCYIKDKEIILADIPGLVEGAHKGVGLGDRFLRHIERCKILLHLMDLSEDNLVNSYKKIKLELSNYDKNLIKKKEIIFLNKSDLLEVNEINEKLKDFKKKVKTKYEIISVYSNKDIQKIKKLLIKYAN